MGSSSSSIFASLAVLSPFDPLLERRRIVARSLVRVRVDPSLAQTRVCSRISSDHAPSRGQSPFPPRSAPGSNEMLGTIPSKRPGGPRGAGGAGWSRSEISLTRIAALEPVQLHESGLARSSHRDVREPHRGQEKVPRAVHAWAEALVIPEAPARRPQSPVV